MNYFDLTGLLYLKKVTPVIRALFTTFSIEERLSSYSEANGSTEIAFDSEMSGSWADIEEELKELITTLGLKITVPNGSPIQMQYLLYTLADHYKSKDIAAITALLKRIDDGEFNGVDLDIVFEIAKCIDDGHGLTAYKTESAWGCSKKRLFEFGGGGSFRGECYALDVSSSDTAAFGEKVNNALVKQDKNEAILMIASSVMSTINGITDVDLRKEILIEVRIQLMQSARSMRA